MGKLLIHPITLESDVGSSVEEIERSEDRTADAESQNGARRFGFPQPVAPFLGHQKSRASYPPPICQVKRARVGQPREISRDFSIPIRPARAPKQV
jgi:hypothetical protein